MLALILTIRLLTPGPVVVEAPEPATPTAAPVEITVDCYRVDRT